MTDLAREHALADRIGARLNGGPVPDADAYMRDVDEMLITPPKVQHLRPEIADLHRLYGIAS